MDIVSTKTNSFPTIVYNKDFQKTTYKAIIPRLWGKQPVTKNIRQKLVLILELGAPEFY